jgi:hypothetical protein
MIVLCRLFQPGDIASVVENGCRRGGVVLHHLLPRYAPSLAAVIKAQVRGQAALQCQFVGWQLGAGSVCQQTPPCPVTAACGQQMERQTAPRFSVINPAGSAGDAVV